MLYFSYSHANQTLCVISDQTSQAFQQGEIIDQETKKVLEKELENCNILLDPEMELIEDEKSTKWPLYTKVLIMKAIDSEKFHKDIIDGFDRLCEIDEKRIGYYQAQWIICLLSIFYSRFALRERL